MNSFDNELNKTENRLPLWKFWLYPIAYYRRKQRRWLINKLLIYRNTFDNILEIGCGERTHFRYSEKIDIKLNGKSIENEIIESNKYDLIIMEEVIEHVEERYTIPIIRNVYRGLKKGGTLILTTPNGELYKLFTFFDRYYISKYHINEQSYWYWERVLSRETFNSGDIASSLFSPVFYGTWKK